ncbi:MAG: HEAT repeat domain-containing protein [Sedimentisphaerales bacterium]|nr:HEAT repeat domain-containing protein [Sedimentisphaerales bacterium]
MEKRRYKLERGVLVVVAAFALYCCCGEVCAAADNSSESARQSKYLAVLQSAEATLPQKARACQELAVVGGRDAVPVLAELLGDQRLGDYARFALEPIDDVSVDEAFRRALDRLDGKLLAGVINSVGVRGDAKAVGVLSKLARDTASGVAGEAIAALGQIATSEAVETITEIMANGPADLRTAAGDATLVAAEKLADQDERDAAAKLYEAICRADMPSHIRAAAVYGRIHLQSYDAGALLVEQLKSDDPAIVEVALRAAREVPGDNVTQKLVAELKKADTALQILLIQALADRGDAGAYDGIKTLATGDSSAVRIEAMKVLARMGDASAIPVLAAAVGKTTEEAKVAAAALRTIETNGADEAIINALKTAEGNARIELIDILSDRRSKIATPVMLIEADSADPSIARAAFKALTELAGGQDLPTLVGLLAKLDSEQTRTYAENACVAAAHKVEDKDKRTEAILVALNSAKNIATRCSLLRILGRIADGRALEALQAAVDDSNDDIRDTAVRALSAWPDSRVIETLSAISQNSSNNTHRVLALRGYVRLVGIDTLLSQADRVAMYKLAMSRADSPGDKKLVLAGLANAAHPDALKIVLEYVDQPQVRDEAILAAMKLAQAAAGARQEDARIAAQKIAEVTTDPQLRSEAGRLVKTIDGFADFIVGWQVAGPYMAENRNHAELFGMALGPEEAGADVKWSVMPAGTDAKRPWILDLLKLWPGNSRVAYLRTWIKSDESKDAVLEAGSDDGIKVWLNGKLVHANNVARAAIPGTDKAKITLKTGWNDLMLKITQNVDPWEFCLRITGADGGKLDEIEVDCLHTAPGS